MRRLTETRPFFVTSEFFGTMAALVALAVTTASSDSLDASHLWPLATARTSEFWASVVMLVALAIAAGTSDEIDARRFWYLATAITIGYVISRGIAKSGTKSRSWDPREDLMESARERGMRQGHGG